MKYDALYDWMDYLGRDVVRLPNLVDEVPDLAMQAQQVAYHATRALLWNLDRVMPDDHTSAHVRCAAAQGIVRAATEHLVLIDPDQLEIEETRMN